MQIILIVIFFIISSTQFAHAYFGPGVALPALLLIIGIVLAILFLILVIFYYPLKKFFRNKKK